MIWLGLLGGAGAARAQSPALMHVMGSPFASEGGPVSVSWSADAKLLAVADAGGVETLKVQPDGSLSLPPEFTPAAGADSVAFSPSGNFLAVAGVNTDLVEMFKVEADGTLTLVSGGTAHTGDSNVEPDGLAFSPSGGLLASANAGNSVSVFEVGINGTLNRVALEPTSNPSGSGNGDAPQTVAFGRGGSVLVTGNVIPHPSTLSVFTVGPRGTPLTHVGQPVPVALSHYTRAVAFNPAGDLLAAANADWGDGESTVSLFTVDANGTLHGGESPAHTSSPHEFDHPYGVAFSPSGGLVATANLFTDSLSLFAVEGDPTLNLLSPEPFPTTNPPNLTPAHSPFSVKFSPSGGLVATANQFGSVSVFHPVGGFAIHKSADVGQVHPGGLVKYTVTLRPAGAAGATGTVTDDLHGVLSAATYQHDAHASVGTVSFDSGTEQLTWDGRLGHGQSATITYSVRVHGSAHGLLRNAADGSPGSSCTGPAPEVPCVLEVPIVEPAAPGPDLTLSKTASITSVHPGGQVVFTLAVHNRGPGAASGVTVQDPTPAGLFLQVARPSQGSCTLTAGLVCRLGSLPAGGGALIVVSATVATDASGSITNQAAVFGAQGDPHPANNTARSTIHVTPLPPPPGPDPGPQPISDLVVTKHVSHTTARVGQTLTYTITVANKGSDPASDVRVIDTPRLPAKVLSVHAGQGTCQAGVPIRCRLGTVQSHARTTITIKAIVTAAGTQVNAATAMSGSWDPAIGSNLAVARTRVHPAFTPPAPPFTG